jgi:hypothetical protein
MAAALATVVFAAPAGARMTGIVGYSGKASGLFCANAGFGCHTANGALPPSVRFDGPTQVDPGSETTYTFVVTSQMPEVQVQAGLNVAASAGELLTITGQRTKLSGGELTHTGPKDNEPNGEVSWQFIWRAPSADGVYVLFGAGNSVDASSTAEGDNGAMTMLMVTVGNVAPPTPTPTVTPMPTGPPGECVGDCNGDGTVAINELIASVNVVLGNLPVSVCTACDANGDGNVVISELIAAVNRSLNGC